MDHISETDCIEALPSFSGGVLFLPSMEEMITGLLYQKMGGNATDTYSKYKEIFFLCRPCGAATHFNLSFRFALPGGGVLFV
jgi:hypothetical protein